MIYSTLDDFGPVICCKVRVDLHIPPLISRVSYSSEGRSNAVLPMKAWEIAVNDGVLANGVPIYSCNILNVSRDSIIGNLLFDSSTCKNISKLLCNL